MKDDIHRHDLKFEAGYPLFQPLDKTRRIEGVIDLATNTNKDAPAFKKPKLTSGQSDSLPTERTKDIHVSPTIDGHVSPRAYDLLKMAQMDCANNAQIFKLARAIPPMIQSSIKTKMKPVVEKLSSLCARVDVLEVEVAAMREEIDRWKELIPHMDINLNIPPSGIDSPLANRSPLDDWCVGYSPTKIAVATKVQDGEPPRVKGPSTMDVSHQGDPYRVALIYLYHEARTLLDRWVMTSPDEPLVFPPNPLMPSVEDITSWNFL
ncbi:hypothetical protein HAX54_041881 [Datura stramonium]|uniref:Uncharacterized protein n=1 Tax=Datura stramonium TaxID=4076 RepID=A0ABS8SLE5_DATST|nr:hypothetical protein [Datura stramonium]